MLTSSCVVQVPFVMDQRKVFNPAESPVTVAPGVFAFGTNVPVPAWTVQVPVSPPAGALPASVALVPQTFWSRPAAATVPLTLIVTVGSFDDRQVEASTTTATYVVAEIGLTLRFPPASPVPTKWPPLP